MFEKANNLNNNISRTVCTLEKIIPVCKSLEDILTSKEGDPDDFEIKMQEFGTLKDNIDALSIEYETYCKELAESEELKLMDEQLKQEILNNGKRKSLLSAEVKQCLIKLKSLFQLKMQEIKALIKDNNEAQRITDRYQNAFTSMVGVNSRFIDNKK